MLEVLAHADLAHQPVLVTVHSGTLTGMCRRALQAISELERVHVAKA